ncbi:MAG: hypothetical protein ACXABK_03230 [Candidatus Heimdallarchaeaceae archaeon]|jgi:hypothetical protein
MDSFLFENIRPVIKRMLEEMCGVREGEKILYVSDYPSAEDFATKPLELLEAMTERNILTKRIFDITTELLSNPVDIYFMKPTYLHYKNPDDKVLEKKINEADIVINLTQFSLTDVPMLVKPLEKGKIRHISGPLIPIDIFLPGGPMDVDFYKMEELTTQLFSLVQGAKLIEFYDVAGSHLSLDFVDAIDWIWESGFATEPGMFSNIPAGEVTLELPYDQRQCLISGTLNIFPGWQDDLTQLLSLIVKENRLVDVVGGGKAGEYLQDLILKEDVRVVQVGIGTNSNAKDPLCATVADKFIGMCHVRFRPDTKVDHYYFPISKMIINETEYVRNQLFE